MDHIAKNNFLKRLSAFGVLLILFLTGFTMSSYAQKSYEFLPAPDAWYNSVDGFRVGLRLRGRQAGTFKSGAHRLNAGIWLGTYIPTYPVSYYVKYTEPIPSLSDYGSEANIAARTSFRTGFQQHGLTFNKRWQNGFDEKNYKEFSVGLRAEDRFEKKYLLYPQLWQNKWLYIASADYLSTNVNSLGRNGLHINANVNFAGRARSFIRTKATLQQQFKLSKSVLLKGRLYAGVASNNTAPEYLFSRSLKSPKDWMKSGLTRARGTIPPSWMEAGNIQITGGPNLRGYLSSDIESLNNGGAPLVTSFSALNLQLNYPNPLGKAINEIPFVGGLLDLNSYLFYDGGTSLGFTQLEESKLLSDAGLGFKFTINIPDYLGKQRGINIRYDLPLWLSDPGSEAAFKFRNVIGIGTTIKL